MGLHETLEQILDAYTAARQKDAFSGRHPVSLLFSELSNQLSQERPLISRPHLRVKWSVGQGNWARVPWIAFLDDHETASTQHGVYPVFLFREDMTGVYLTFNQGVTELKSKHGTPEARRILRERAAELRRYCDSASKAGFTLDNDIDLRCEGGLGRDYEFSTVAYRLYTRGAVPTDQHILADIEQMLTAYDMYIEARKKPGVRSTPPDRATPTAPGFRIGQAVQEVLSYIEGLGFVYEPWQIAQYITAIRTKPFIILAGITGTGKSKLPALVAAATGGESRLIPVRPDWTDSSDVLGYTDLQGDFRPGAVLEMAARASSGSDQFWTCIVDEMNLARVEQYFAEVLSKIEDRRPLPEGGYASGPLLGQTLQEKDAEWCEVFIPPNLAFVGTVNMDESTHGFSRKVLDRAFTIELSEVHLDRWESQPHPRLPSEAVSAWPVRAWFPRATMLAELTDLGDTERTEIARTIATLSVVNQVLTPAQLQVGYRTRDEVAQYVLQARDIADAFVTRDGQAVDPLDLALQMKILPRIVGGSAPIRQVVLGLLGWATTGEPAKTDEDVRPVFDSWQHSGRPSTMAGMTYPRLTAKLCLMWERLLTEGFTSYWL